MTVCQSSSLPGALVDGQPSRHCISLSTMLHVTPGFFYHGGCGSMCKSTEKYELWLHHLRIEAIPPILPLVMWQAMPNSIKGQHHSGRLSSLNINYSAHSNLPTTLIFILLCKWLRPCHCPGSYQKQQSCETTIFWLPYYSSQPFETYKTGLADRWDPLAFAAQEELKNKTKWKNVSPASWPGAWTCDPSSIL